MFDGFVSGALGFSLLFGCHGGIAVGVPYHALAGENFEPGAGGRISSVGQVEVVSIPAEDVAQVVSCVLHCCAAWHEYQFGVVVQDVLHAGEDGLVHGRLVAVVAWKMRVVGVGGIRPCHHPAEVCGGLVFPYGVDECCEVGFEGAVDAAIPARLLEGDIIPLLQS